MAEFTSFELDYQLDDDDAKDDATVTAVGNSSIADISLINDPNEFPKVITTEHNYTILDGSYDAYQYNNIGFWSTAKSNSQGTFTTNPKLIIDFENVHKSYTLTIHFIEDAPRLIQVTWYHNSVVLSSIEVSVTNDNPKVEINNAVANYNKIEIEFVEAIPDRYIKIDYLEYGTTMHWDETIIKSGTLVKGLNRLGDMLSIDTLDFELVDTSNSMNLGNPNGLHTLFKKNQAMYPKEIVDDDEVPLGVFYLDSFTNDANVGKIHAVSIMGLLDKIQFSGDGVYTGRRADLVIGEIFQTAGIENYSVDAFTSNQLLYGVVAPKSCKEALRDVLFATHSVIDTSNPDIIEIHKYSDVITANLTRNNKVSTSVSTREYVTGVKLKYTNYVVGTDRVNIATDTYKTGEHTVTFDNPYYEILLTGGTQISSTAYSVTFSVSSQTEITITGIPYQPDEHSVTIKTDVPKGETENVREFSTTLCNLDTATELVKKLFSYFNDYPFVINIQHYCTDVGMNDMSLIENSEPSLADFIGMFEERSIDLTGGFFDSAKLIGRFDISNKHYFTGTEIYIDEQIGII